MQNSFRWSFVSCSTLSLLRSLTCTMLSQHNWLWILFGSSVCSWVLYHDLGIKLQASLFCTLFMIKRHPYGKGWWFVGSRHGQSFIKGLSFSIHGWKSSLFFLLSNHSWVFSTEWREPRLTPNDSNKVLKADKEDFEKLLKVKAPLVKELLKE